MTEKNNFFYIKTIFRLKDKKNGSKSIFTDSIISYLEPVSNTADNSGSNNNSDYQFFSFDFGSWK